MSLHSPLKCRDSIASPLVLSPMTLAASHLVVISNIWSLSVYCTSLISSWLCVFFIISVVHIIFASFSHSTFSPLRSNMASLLVPHNAVLRHLPLLEHFFGCYLPHIVTENTSFQEIQCSIQRKFWNGNHGDLYPQKTSCTKDEMGLVKLKREENSLGGNRKFWWMRCISKAQGDHSRSVGSCQCLGYVSTLIEHQNHRVPVFMYSEQRQVLCASLFLSLGLLLDVPGMFLPWKPGLFLPLELSISSLEMQISLLGAKIRNNLLFSKVPITPQRKLPQTGWWQREV